MKITATQTSPSFQRLYMPSKEENTKKVGAYFANELEKARPTLEKMAEKSDIFVKPEKSSDSDYFAWCRVGVMNAGKGFFEKLSNFKNHCEETVRLINLPAFEKIDAKHGETKQRPSNESVLIETAKTLKKDLEELKN